MPRKGNGHEYVPIEPLRDRFLRMVENGEISATELASRLGWIRTDTNTPDSTRVRRALGLKTTLTRGGSTERKVQTQVRYETAVLLAQGLHMDPFEAGV